MKERVKLKIAGGAVNCLEKQGGPLETKRSRDLIWQGEAHPSSNPRSSGL